MKKLILLVSALIFTLNTNAQLDRSVMPIGGPSPKIKLQKPKEFKLKNGIRVLVVENHKLPRINYSLRFDRNPIVEGEKAGVISLLGSMLGNGTKNISKDDFNEEVDFLGAGINVSFGSGFAFTLTKNNERVLDLFSDAIINPLLTEEEFEKEKEKLIEGLKAQKKDIDAISGRVGDALSYGKSHAYGEFITEQTINNISFQDILDFHAKYFIPNNVYIVVIGDINYKEVKSLISKKFGVWKKGKAINDPQPILTDNVALTEINFIDLPTATQSAIQVTNNVNLKMTNEDYFAALMANDILGGGGEGYLFKNLREDKGYTYGAYSSLGSNRYGVSKFRAGAKVRNMVTDSAVSEIIKEISRIRLEKVDSELLKNAKAKYVGSFIRNAENPQTIAGYALNIKINNLPSDYYETYLENINSVSEADVKKAANKYFKIANTRIIVVGKGSDVVANLEEVGFPINFYDQFANPIAKPIFNKAIPDGLTAYDVIDRYLNVIGGRDKLESVNTLITNGELELPAGTPQQVILSVKQKMPNMESVKQKVLMGGQVVMEGGQSFDGETGYIQGPQGRMDMDDETISKKKTVQGIFEELYYSVKQLELVNISNVDGDDAYKIKIMDGADISYRYYSISKGYLLSVESEDKNKNVNTTNYSDFRTVDGIIFPFKLELQGQKISISEIIVNQEIKDSSF
tara:strand:+ start:3391 stop:5454 length:2064 start_codon:yes stop_codon:yes gene_type:complete